LIEDFIEVHKAFGRLKEEIIFDKRLLRPTNFIGGLTSQEIMKSRYIELLNKVSKILEEARRRTLRQGVCE